MNSPITSHLLSSATDGLAATKSGGASQLLLPLLLVAAFYFFLIRPQRNRQKQATNLRSQLLPGSKIVTIGGLFGTVTDVTDEDFGLVIAPGVEVRFTKAALGRVIPPEGEHESLPAEPEEPEPSTD